MLTDIVRRSWTHISMTTGQQDTETECHHGKVGQWSMHIYTPASCYAPQFKPTHKMLKICLILTTLSSVVFSTQLEDIADVRRGAARDPKLFFVSSSSTTSTISTSTLCYSTINSAATTCPGRKKKRAIMEAIGKQGIGDLILLKCCSVCGSGWWGYMYLVKSINYYEKLRKLKDNLNIP